MMMIMWLSFDTSRTKYDKSYYVSTLKSQAVLNNGFRYIKELLMQHHNFLIHQSFETLKENNIKVYSIKTDALTLKASDIEKAKQL